MLIVQNYTKELQFASYLGLWLFIQLFIFPGILNCLTSPAHQATGSCKAECNSSRMPQLQSELASNSSQLPTFPENCLKPNGSCLIRKFNSSYRGLQLIDWLTRCNRPACLNRETILWCKSDFDLPVKSVYSSYSAEPHSCLAFFLLCTVFIIPLLQSALPQ